MYAPSKSRTFMPLALLAAIAMTCLQGAAFAGEVPMEPAAKSVFIQTAGLNLASPDAQAKVDEQIRRAARTVCGPENYRDLRALAERPACEKAAITSASAKRDMLVARAQAEQLAGRAGSRIDVVTN